MKDERLNIEIKLKANTNMKTLIIIFSLLFSGIDNNNEYPPIRLPDGYETKQSFEAIDLTDRRLHSFKCIFKNVTDGSKLSSPLYFSLIYHGKSKYEAAISGGAEWVTIDAWVTKLNTINFIETTPVGNKNFTTINSDLRN